MEPPEFLTSEAATPGPPPPARRRRPPPRPGVGDEYPAPPGPGIWALGGRLGWVAGLVLALSSFMGWYSGGAEEGPSVAVLGWNTGTLGKLVFFVGLAVVCLAVLRALGVEPPRSLPHSLLVVALGTLGTVFVLVRVVSIPDALAGTGDRAVGLWVALIAALAVLVAGLLQAEEEL